jgi:hypothetical protein
METYAILLAILAIPFLIEPSVFSIPYCAILVKA